MKLKKVFVLSLFILVIISNEVFCETTLSGEPVKEKSVKRGRDNFHFTIEPLISLGFGTLNEIVFSEKTGEKRKLSELEWTVKPALMLGGTFTFIHKIFHFSFSVSSSISPLPSDEMEDSDYLATDYPLMKTNLSLNENTLNSTYWFDTAFKTLFNPTSHLSLGPVLEVEYRSYNFSACDGEGSYGDSGSTGLPYDVPYTSPEAKHYSAGELLGIDYERNEFYIFVGLDLLFHAGRYIDIGLGLFTSPYFFLVSYDHHFTPKGSDKAYYLDKLVGDNFFKAFKGEFDISFKFTERNILKFGVNYLFMNEITGDAYHGTEGKYGEYHLYDRKNSRSGASEKVFNFSISFLFMPV